MKIADLSKAVCSCKNKGRIFYNNKWWCSIESDFGAFNMRGYCANSKKRRK